MLFDQQAGNVTRALNEMRNQNFCNDFGGTKQDDKSPVGIALSGSQENQDPIRTFLPNRLQTNTLDAEAIVIPTKIRNSQVLIAKPRSLTLER